MKLRKVFDYGDIFDDMFYPAGEPHVRLRPEFVRDHDDRFRPMIVSSASNWNDLVTIRIGDGILKDNGIKATFVVPYMPFSRHDRKNDRLDSMPISMVKEILAPVHVLTIDPHSDVTNEWFPNYPQSEVVKLYDKASLFANDAMVAIPDAGATKKTYSWLDGRDVVQCLKTRDPKTGKLSGFHVINSKLVKDRHVVIVDDICDGGGTFLGLANELHAAGASSLRLAVSHGLFTKGFDDLLRKFARIYTLDTCSTPEGGALFTVSTEELIMEGSYF